MKHSSGASLEADHRPPAAPRATLVAGLAALGALALRYFVVSRPGGLTGITEYDDGAYLAGAVRFVHGAMPYRDFAFVQPPGVILFAAPVALLSRVIGTRDGMIIMRLIMPTVDALNVFAVGWLVRHKGPTAALAGAGLVAVYLPSIMASRTLLLEPLMDLACLVGLCLAFHHGRLASSRRLAAAGTALAVATSIKAWAVIPLVVLFACVLIAAHGRRWRAGGALVAGGLVGGVIVVGPFFFAAPHAFVHDVITTQIDRTIPSPTPLAVRLTELAGITTLPNPHTPISESALVLGAIGCVLATAALITAARRDPVSVLAVYTVGSMAGLLLAMFVTSTFYYHYPAGVAPFAAIAVGLAVGTITAAVAGRRRRMLTAAPATLAVLGLLTWSAVHDVGIIRQLHAFDPAPWVDAIIPPGSCVYTDIAAITLLSDRFVATSPSCPSMVDLTGTDLVLDHGHLPGLRPTASRALVALVVYDLRHSSYAILSSSSGARMPWTTSMRRAFDDRFRPVSKGYGEIYVLRRP